MSHSAYHEIWHKANVELTSILEVELPKQPPKPEKDRLVAFQKFATMYVRYVLIFRKLEECYDQIVHPQKRRLIKHVLDGVIGRILELKNEMVNLEFLEFHYFDDILADMKLTPQDIELPIPRYVISENAKVLKEREKMLGTILARMGPQDSSADNGKDEHGMTTEEAIKLIQIHERGRQGRLRARLMKEIRMQDEMENLAKTRGPPKLDRDVAAITIQKMCRGFLQRKQTAKMRAEELVFLGMVPPPKSKSQKNMPVHVAKKVEDKRRLTQEHHEKGYLESLVTVKDKLREVEGPDIKEQMQDQIRQWFIEVRDATGKFPDYPDIDEGGSEAIFKKKVVEDKDEDKDAGKKGKKGKKGGKKEKDKKKKDKKGKKKGKGEEEDEGIVMAPSKFVPTIQEGFTSYAGVWQHRDETGNFLQKHDVEIVKEEKRIEIEKEVRVQVDELMREELKNLKLAVDRDKGTKKKKGKKKGKKKKGKKGKKGKKEKDLTPDRTIESLYEELVQEGIIVRCPKIQLSDYVGEYSYLATTLRQNNIEPMPSLSDVRRVITEHCILPLSCQAVHEQAPHVKSLMITGPRGVGKKMLVHTICTETGSILFDLTPSNIATRYPGKAGLNMLLHMVFKVAKHWPPGVIHIDSCERTWVKKIPKTDKTDPKRVKKALPKLLKTMKVDDRVMIIGTTKSPFDADAKGLCGMYERIIMIPRPDYASRLVLWRNLVLRNGGRITDMLDLSCLAKVTDGYTPGHMNTAVTQVLNERRIAQLHKRPLVASELIAPLSKIDPIYHEEEEAYKIWYGSKTKLGKKRAQLAKGEDDDGVSKGKKGKGKKGKKK